ncbi:MAG: replicative DNA helicase [Verrucomicrobiaceae bacterium]|nr:replicative DNA helicase [Verrucomicrobiaceae bacterium]
MPEDSTDPAPSQDQDPPESLDEPLVALAAEDAPELQTHDIGDPRPASTSPSRDNQRLRRPLDENPPNAQEISRALPNNADAEKGVLSAMLQSPRENIGDAVEKLKPEAFYVPAHATLFELILKLYDSGQPIDAITLQEALLRENLMDKVGGPAAVLEIMDFIPDASHFDFYVDLVLEKALLRRIISTCTDSIKSAYSHEMEPEQILAQVEVDIMDIGNERNSAVAQGDMLSHVMSAIEAIQETFENRGKVQGIPTGFVDIDKQINGMTPGQMIIIAARPSMGKTSLAMNIAEHVAVEQELPVAIFSLEMTTQDLVQRLLCSRARVNGQNIRSGMPEQQDFPKLMKAADELAKAKMFIDETPSISIMEMRAKARRLKQKEDIQLVIVDYLQLMRSTTRRAQDNRQLEISEISSGLKALAKELEVPVIVLAQVNRNPEERKGGRPRLSDLRESGSLEQDADVVGLLMRPERYADDDDESADLEGEATFIIAKQRSGPIGDVPLIFISDQVRFADRARESEH